MAVEIQLEPYVHFLLLRVSGDLRIWDRPELEKQLQQGFQSVFDSEQKLLILSLRGLSHIDSHAIGMLARFLAGCERRQVAVNIVTPAGVPEAALRIVRILTGFTKFDDEAMAMLACGPLGTIG